MNHTYLRGDMYYADLGQGVGSEQEGYRPVVIIQNNVGNKHILFACLIFTLTAPLYIWTIL